MRPRFNRVNVKYDVGKDYEMLYAHIIVPKGRSSELRTKLNTLLGWFMARQNILGINNKTEKYKDQEYEPKRTNGKRGRPRLIIDQDSNVSEEDHDTT